MPLGWGNFWVPGVRNNVRSVPTGLLPRNLWWVGGLLHSPILIDHKPFCTELYEHLRTKSYVDRRDLYVQFYLGISLFRAVSPARLSLPASRRNYSFQRSFDVCLTLNNLGFTPSNQTTVLHAVLLCCAL